KAPTPAFRRRQGPACLTPDVALEDVVIVGYHDARAVAQQLAPRPAMLPILAQVVQHRLFGRLQAGDAEAAVTLINLVAGKVQDVRVLNTDIANHPLLREALAV